MPFSFEDLAIQDVKLIKPKVFEDDRGYFLELFKNSDFKDAGITEPFLQDNFSFSGINVLRGLHYQQEPHMQAKMVHCLRGKIFDVAVDLRPNSKTFGQWVSTILSEENHNILYIPSGFAHGFLTMAEKNLVLYKTTKEYAPNADRGIMWNDPEINIEWPTIEKLVISDKDHKHPSFVEIKKILEG